MRNLPLKIFSITISLVLAYYVHSESNTTIRTFVAPIEVQNLPKDKVKVSPINPSAQVTVRGPGFLVSRIPLAPPVFSVVLPDTVEKRFKARLHAPSLELPPSVEVLAVEPAEVDLAFDSQGERSVPIVVPQIGAPPEGTVVSRITVEPQRVLLAGPDSIIKKINDVESEPLELRNRTESFTVTLPLRALSSSLVTAALDSVRVSVQLAPLMVDRRIDGVAVRIAEPGRFKSSPQKVAVTVRGTRGEVQRISADQVSVDLDLGGGAALGAGHYRLSGSAPGAQVISIDPSEVQIVRLAGNPPPVKRRGREGKRSG